VSSLAEQLVRAAGLVFRRVDGTVRTFLSGDDVTDAIRTPDIGMGASTVSAHPGVRDALLDLQRQAGKDGGVVLEGRDIGTVVFPDAEVKVFLTASPEVRARRRFDELVARGNTRVTFEETLADVKKRDAQDEGRAVAPLKQADDAVRVDTSAMTIDEAVQRIVTLAERGRSA
jgi:cytidylate kinase